MSDITHSIIIGEALETLKSIGYRIDLEMGIRQGVNDNEGELTDYGKRLHVMTKLQEVDERNRNFGYLIGTDFETNTSTHWFNERAAAKYLSSEMSLHPETYVDPLARENFMRTFSNTRQPSGVVIINGKTRL